MSFTIPYSKLYILTEIRANDVKLISVDRQKLDLSKYIYLWYRKSILVEIQLDSTTLVCFALNAIYLILLPKSITQVKSVQIEIPDKSPMYEMSLPAKIVPDES